MRKIIKRLKAMDYGQHSYSLEWKEITSKAELDEYVYQWNISDLNNDQNMQGKKAPFYQQTEKQTDILVCLLVWSRQIAKQNWL